jgi:hypothetical protein
LGDQALEFPERLPLENPADFVALFRLAFALDQIPALFEERPGRLGHSLLQLLLPLNFRQSGELAYRKLQEFAHLVVDIRSPGGRRGLPSRKEL